MPQSDPFPDQNVKLPEPRSDHRDAAESDHIDDELLPSHLIRRRLDPYLRIKLAKVYKDHRFDLRFFRPFRADLSIKKSSSFFPSFIAATSQRGFTPRPDPSFARWTTIFWRDFPSFQCARTSVANHGNCLPFLSNCFAISARRSKSIWSTLFRRSISVSTLISDRFTFAIVISPEKTDSLCSESKVTANPWTFGIFGLRYFRPTLSTRAGRGPVQAGAG